MTTTPPRRPTPLTVLPVGKRIGARVDKQLSDDMSILLRAHPTVSDALRWAVHIATNALWTAWETGVCPVGQLPTITGYQYAPSDTTAEETR